MDEPGAPEPSAQHCQTPVAHGRTRMPPRMLSGVLAIVPVNAPVGAKRRLESVLSSGEREELVAVMLADVLEACRRAHMVRDILLVTPDAGLAPPDVDVLPDPGRGHAVAIALGLAQAPESGALVVMGDCPLVTADGLDRLAHAAKPVAIAPAQDGGTNALALCPADAVEPAFGLPNGAELVLERARRAGLAAALVEDGRIALDVDTPDDVQRMLELGEGTRTTAFLRRTLAVGAVSQSPGRA
jgi:2-phospho-L-lactate/phosphoenolpyruvate guanylyltransferase